MGQIYVKGCFSFIKTKGKRTSSNRYLKYITKSYSLFFNDFHYKNWKISGQLTSIYDTLFWAPYSLHRTVCILSSYLTPFLNRWRKSQKLPYFWTMKLFQPSRIHQRFHIYVQKISILLLVHIQLDFRLRLFFTIILIVLCENIIR